MNACITIGAIRITITDGKIKIDDIGTFTMVLPGSEEFYHMDLSGDAKEGFAAEKESKK